jgi:hypothetical protein
MTRSPRPPSLFLRGVAVAVALLSAGTLSLSADEAPRKVIVDPPGNRSAEQPEISASSIARTAETRGDFESKYREVHDQLAGDRQLLDKIVKTAALYGIGPIHILGAIVGEHTYNVDVFDNLQGYYIKAIAYLNNGALKFEYKGEPVDAFIMRPQFAPCAEAKNDYELWTCRDQIWRDDFRGKTVAGESFPDDRFERVFFQPFYAGQTFGLGQLSPLAALSVSDLVHAVGGLPPLDVQAAPEVYRAVMDPDMTLNYMAALIVREIDAYRSIAGFDISDNPGITATLYNTGDAVGRAAALAAENRKRRSEGLAPILPKENYYGWLINARLDELRQLLPGEPLPAATNKPASPPVKP